MRIHAHDLWKLPDESRPVVKAFLDGRNVTSLCREADDDEGWVMLYKTNEKGEKYVDPETGDAAMERLTGKVQIMMD